jgi:glycosyltransferase involved in cell wall biosynthesis
VRIVVLGVYAREVVTFRGELLRRMTAAGHDVLALAPEDDPAVRDALRAMGVRYATVPFERAALDPVADLGTLASLTRRFRRGRPGLVLVYGAKPVVWGSLAARIARVPRRAAMITGAGSALRPGRSARGRVLAAAMRLLVRISLSGVHVVLFQNPDDLASFRSRRLIGRSQRAVLIAGSGVDLEQFVPTPLPAPPVTFLMIARLIRDKGVHEYVEAARLVRAVHPETRFRLLGPLDSNPTAVSAEEVAAWSRSGAVDVLGEATDVRPFIAAAHVVVLPSYHEGLPRAVLEAMAMARPIIATDVPGCRETVRPGENGWLVPVRDGRALAKAMLDAVACPEDLAPMGAASRRLAEERFDVHRVNEVIMDALGLD